MNLPRAIWADSGETPVMLVELGWNRFRLFARANDGTWKVMSAPMTAHESGNPYAKRLDGSVDDWTAVGTSLSRWLGETYDELTGSSS